MKNKIVVITGGGSGIGFAIIRELINDNTVISLDRNPAKIEKLKKAFPKVESIQTDIRSNDELTNAIASVERSHSKIDVLINNAGVGYPLDFAKSTEKELMDNIEAEIEINYHAPILLTKKALHLLKRSQEPTVVIVSSGLAYVPIAMLGTYCASKAAIHFVAMSMRLQLEASKIRVVEVLPPVVDTDMGNAPVKKMPADKFAQEFLKRLAKGEDEMNIGQTAGLKKFSRFFPKMAFKMLNKPAPVK